MNLDRPTLEGLKEDFFAHLLLLSFYFCLRFFTHGGWQTFFKGFFVFVVILYITVVLMLIFGE